ncbi:hypothetical protein OZX74_05000 [Bifidobacterium sp. ESL0798]|uniref:hypothetical protein n=1 Tax=Bifidobacterium sp. ESL0798 TaxID=2983235 RepID=UPI0023F742E0|nr:hypothetical protein [Bifidobacterium sp. ESL0798]WEV73319.1 hypothetical protein OZX74_05000 [Bifidobacterium sp. ESL0798]
MASGNVQGDTSAPGNGKNESDKTVVENGKDTIKSDATQILTPSASGETTAMPPVGQKQQGKSATGTSKKLKGGPGQSDGHIRVFDSSKQKRYKRLAIVVAVVSALVAVGITAGVISLVTKGEGTDHVVRNIVTNSTIKNPKQQQEDSGKTSTDGSEKTDRNTQGNNTTTNQNNSGSTSDSGTQSGSTSNGTGTSSNSGNSSSSNNSGNTTSGSTGGGTGSDSNSSGSGSTDSSNSGTNTGNGSTDSGSTNGSTSGGTGTGGNESGSTSGSQSGNGGTGTTPGTTK